MSRLQWILYLTCIAAMFKQSQTWNGVEGYLPPEVLRTGDHKNPALIYLMEVLFINRYPRPDAVWPWYEIRRHQNIYKLRNLCALIWNLASPGYVRNCIVITHMMGDHNNNNISVMNRNYRMDNLACHCRLTLIGHDSTVKYDNTRPFFIVPHSLTKYFVFLNNGDSLKLINFMQNVTNFINISKDEFYYDYHVI